MTLRLATARSRDGAKVPAAGANMDYRKRPPSRDDAPSPERRKKSPPGPPMTLGNAAAARVRLIVWCKACGHRAEPDPAEIAQRYGAETTVPDWRERLVCSQMRQPQYRHGGDRDRAGIAVTAPLLSKSPSRPLPTYCSHSHRIFCSALGHDDLWRERFWASKPHLPRLPPAVYRNVLRPGRLECTLVEPRSRGLSRGHAAITSCRH